MKKVITVHLGSKVFQMEDDAYQYLQQVLEGQWKKDELEEQFAEILPSATVISLNDVRMAIGRLGVAAGTPPPKSDEHIRHLYRKPKGKILGGVCGGLGDYLEVDTVVVRILFVAVTFLSCGIGLIGYLALWLLIHQAPSAQ